MARKKSDRMRNRVSRSKTLRPSILIVCEGRKTEPGYFTDLKRATFGRDSLINLEIISGDKAKGSHPMKLVTHAIRMMQKTDFREVWCVFDRDQHEKLREVFDLARKEKIQIAFSNPCFEIWYLLHYRDQTAHIEREKLCAKLRKSLKGYDKAMEGVYDLILSQQSQAVKRAIALRSRYGNKEDLKRLNPWTDVDLLVGILNDLAAREAR